MHVVLIIGLGMGVEGFFLGQFASAVIMSIYWVVWMRQYWHFSWRTAVGQELRYSIYQLPIAVVDAANRVVDKFLLEKYVGLAQFGIYSVADKFGGLFYQVNGSLKAAFFPIIYKMVGQGDPGAEKMLPRVSMLYYLFLAYTALLFSLLGESFVRLFANPEFHGVIQYIPWFILIYFIKSQETVWGRGADIAKRNDIQMYVSVPLLLGSIALTYFLVRQHGILGAIVGLLIATTVRVGILVYVGHRLYRRVFPWLPVLAITTFCWLVYFGASLIDLTSQLANFVARFSVSTFFWFVFFYLYIRFADSRVTRRSDTADRYAQSGLKSK
jgi:O-antigen/teichoic acid export membrane protein